MSDHPLIFFCRMELRLNEFEVAQIVPAMDVQNTYYYYYNIYIVLFMAGWWQQRTSCSATFISVNW